MFTYALTGIGSPSTILRSDGLEFPQDPGQAAYQEYLAWLAAGHTVTPAPPESIDAPYDRARAIVNARYTDARVARVSRVMPPDVGTVMRFDEADFYESDPSPSDPDYPLLAAEVPVTGATVDLVHDAVLGESLLLRQDLGQLERIRRNAFADIADATTVEELQAILEALDFTIGRVAPALANATGTAYAPTVSVGGGSSTPMGFWPGFFLAGGLPIGNPASYSRIAWATFPALDPSDRDIYVSAAGNDSNDGLSTGAPKLTIAAGHALLRDGHGDRLWLRRGDTFTNQRIGLWTKSGASPTRPMVFGAYGTGARPIIDTQNSAFFTTNGSDATVPNYLFFESLNIVSTTYSGGGSLYGISLFTGTAAGCNYITIQDCRIFNFGHIGFIAQHDGNTYPDLSGVRHSNIHVIGCHIEDVYVNSTSDAHGGYLQGIDNLTIEWTHADRATQTDPSQWANRKHNYYIHNSCQGVVFRYNIDTNGNDTQIRPGGTVHHNIHSRCTWGYQFGLGTLPGIATATGLFEDNCVLDSGDEASTDLTTGLRCGNANGVSIKRNMFVKSNSSTPYGFWLQAWDGTGASGLAMTNCLVEDNIVHDFGGIGLSTSFGVVGTDWLGNTFKRNHIQSPNVSTPGGGTGHDIVFNFLSGMSSATWEMANNVVNRNGGIDDLWLMGGGPYDIPGTEWNAAFADATTSTASVSYAHADRATLGGYYVYGLGNVSLGSEALNHAAMVALIKSNEKASWDDRYTAPAIHAYIVECMTPV